MVCFDYLPFVRVASASARAEHVYMDCLLGDRWVMRRRGYTFERTSLCSIRTTSSSFQSTIGGLSSTIKREAWLACVDSIGQGDSSKFQQAYIQKAEQWSTLTGRGDRSGANREHLRGSSYRGEARTIPLCQLWMNRDMQRPKLLSLPWEVLSEIFKLLPTEDRWRAIAFHLGMKLEGNGPNITSCCFAGSELCL